MRIIRNAVLAAALVPLACGSALAQAAPPASAPPTNLDAKPGALSDKLSDTNGVIRPTQDVDPGIGKPAPQAGPMPVVKPGAVAPGTAK